MSKTAAFPASSPPQSAVTSAVATTVLLAGIVLAAVLPLTACAGAAPPRPSERMVNLGFEDVVGSDPARLGSLAERLDAVDATAVSIAVGRTDWTAFPWPGNEDSQADEVSRTGRDFVAESMAALQRSGTGADRDVLLTIDVLLDRALRKNPSLAGRNAGGEASPAFASVSALRHGEAGSRLAELAAAVARNYRPTAVNLTELMFDDFTFGADDLSDFRASTGAVDWPRRSDGSIEGTAPELAAWRSEAMADIVRRVRAAVEPFGVGLDMDVRSPRESAAGDRADSGQDYDLLLGQLDRLHVWEYVGLNDERSPRTVELAKALRQRAGSRFSVSVGLWAEQGTIPAEQFGTALRQAAEGGAAAVSVTPASLMDDRHWEVLRKAWAQ